MKKWLWFLAAAAGIVAVCAALTWNHSCPQDAVWLEAYDAPEGTTLPLAEPEGTPDAAAQLETLAALGFAPSEAEADAFQNYIFSEIGWPLETLEMYPYWLCFTALGACYVPGDVYDLDLSAEADFARVGEARWFSDDTMHIPHANFDSPEQYAYVLSQLERITGGEIRLENIQAGRCWPDRWISFDWNGETYAYRIQTESTNWFNANLLTEIDRLAGPGPEGQRLYWRDDALGFDITYRTPEALEALAEQTGISFTGLSRGQVPLG